MLECCSHPLIFLKGNFFLTLDYVFVCGIAGILMSGAISEPAQQSLQQMASTLTHRGPDSEGYFLKGPIGLAHTRLSIIDLHTGEQPIHNNNKTVWVVFNGEIFNYIELRQSLTQKGYEFYTQSDTEVIVHLYEEYGDDFVKYLNGQFAIALWDENQQRLLLLRDRVGIAPLYYCYKNGNLLFASEVKAILAVLDESPRLNVEALNQVFTFWSPLAENTLFEGISCLEPGKLLDVRLTDNNSLSIQQHCYWDLDFPCSSEEYLQENDAELGQRLYQHIVNATSIRLRADVPVGAYLSGGLDSSALVSTISRHSEAELRTFSIGFEEKALDESHYQKLMVEHVKTDHSHLSVSNKDVANAFYKGIWHSEKPVLRTALAPMHLLSGSVRHSGFKVVLTGEGADEVLGGYDIFKEAKVRQFWAKQPDSKWRPLLLKRLYPYLNLSKGSESSYLKSAFGLGLDNPVFPGFSHLLRWDTSAKAKAFFSKDMAVSIKRDPVEDWLKQLPKQFSEWSPFNRSQFIEFKLLMGGYLLNSQGDRMLMSNSVEGRFPFLDHNLIEFAAKLPESLKMKVLNEKYLLKKAFAEHLPSEIINRYKQPYRAPDSQALFDTNGNARSEYIDELLSESALSDFGYFDTKKASLLVKKARSGRLQSIRDNQALVGVLSTQLWHHHFIKNFKHRL